MLRPWITLAIVLAAMPFVVRAQTFQALPEIDAYYRFDPNFRVYFQVKETREGGAPTTAEIGPSPDFHLMSMEQLREIRSLLHHCSEWQSKKAVRYVRWGKGITKTGSVAASVVGEWRSLPTAAQPQSDAAGNRLTSSPG